MSEPTPKTLYSASPIDMTSLAVRKNQALAVEGWRLEASLGRETGMYTFRSRSKRGTLHKLRASLISTGTFLTAS
jgi:hypothetical protein